MAATWAAAIKVRGRSNTCPLSHSPAPRSPSHVPSHAPCMCTYSPPRVRLTLVHRPPVAATGRCIHLYHHGLRLSSSVRHGRRRRSCRCNPPAAAHGRVAAFDGSGAGSRDGCGGGRGVGMVAAGDGGGAGRGNGDGERDAARVKVRVRVRCTLHAAHCTLPPTCTPFRSPPPSSRPRSARRSWPPSLRRRCTQRPRRPFPFPAPLPCTCGHASMPCRACTHVHVTRVHAVARG